MLNPDGTLYTADTAHRLGHRHVHPQGRRRGDVRAALHLPRVPLRRGDRVPGTPPATAVTGRVMHTSAPFTLDFETDVPTLNKLHSNITWGQRGNFLSIPTDTPARDERLGWTGDMNVFAPTAAYTMESARFLTKWLVDLRDAQTPEGAFTDVAPMVGTVGNGVAGWGDEGVAVALVPVRRAGDRQVLEDAWPSIQAWLKYLEKNSDHLLPAGQQFRRLAERLPTRLPRTSSPPASSRTAPTSRPARPRSSARTPPPTSTSSSASAPLSRTPTSPPRAGCRRRAERPMSSPCR